MSSAEIAAVRAAALDGRAQTVYYKLNQLEKLREILVKETSAIQNAIVADTGVTPTEAKIEYSLALETLRNRYTELNADKALAEEYSVAKGHNAPDLRPGVGLVALKPSSYSPFYSVIAPLAAAIAGGNVVIVQFENSTRQLPDLLKSIIKPALDHESIAFTSSSVTLDQPNIQVTETKDSNSPPSNQIASSSTALSIALVDRNADFEAAATALVNARFSYRGRSPHAPDLVLVNEFGKKDLLQALVRASIASSNSLEPIHTNGSLEKKPASSTDLQSLISDLQNSSARLIHQASTGAILDLPTRSPSLLTRKVSSPALLVHSIRSLDDAIDFLTSTTGHTYVCAAYFADAGSAKYLSQFIPAQASFANHIPAEILVGPAFPLSHPVDPANRYPTDLFTVPRPAFTAAERAKGTGPVLDKTGLVEGPRERNKAVDELYRAAVQELPVAKRKKQLNAGFGFFEQAFVLHFSFIVLTTVTTVSGSVWWLAKGNGWRPWR